MLLVYKYKSKGIRTKIRMAPIAITRSSDYEKHLQIIKNTFSLKMMLQPGKRDWC
jgi:hypothetical protein